MQAEAHASERKAAAVAPAQIVMPEVSSYMHVPSALCANSVQSDAAALEMTTAQTLKRKQ